MRRRVPSLNAPLVLIALAVAVPAHAAEEDTQIWTSATASTNLGSRGVATFEGQLRLTDDAARVGQVVIRPSVGLKLDQNTTVSLGYAYVFTDPVGPTQSDEHRVWQQVSFRLAGDGQNITLTGRTRLEQRWFERAPDMGWRFRQQLRLTAPLGGNVRAAAWSEVFVSLDDTSWGQSSGIDRWRNSVGVVVPINRSVSIEPGYINQWVNRPGGDRVHHIANISLSGRF